MAYHWCGSNRSMKAYTALYDFQTATVGNVTLRSNRNLTPKDP